MTVDVAELGRATLPTLVKYAAEVDRESRFPSEALQDLSDRGLMGLLVPAEYGGLGGGLADLVQLAEQLASGCLSTALIWSMHCQQVDALVNFASPELRRRLLPRIARGELYLGSVTTEPGKGGHLLTAVAALAEADGELRLDRGAPVVTGGEHADGFLVTMRSAEDARENQVTLVYADREQLSIVVDGDWDALGMRGTRSVALRLTGSVPVEQIVGASGHFRTVAVESMAPLGHLAWAACWLGAARGALSQFVALTRSSTKPGGFDVRSDLATERLARVRIELELVSAYLYQVLDEVIGLRAAGKSLDTPATQIHLNTLKVIAAERTFGAVDRLVQLAGMSLGYRQGSAVPLERYFRDLRSASLNYANDRLLTATGALTVLDRGVHLARGGDL